MGRRFRKPQNATQPPRAWQGPNPITQRASTHTPNGTEKPLPKLPPAAQTQNKSITDSHAENHAHDRALFILANFTGKDTTLTLKNGEQFTGIFSGASCESNFKQQYVLKMVKRTKVATHQQANGDIELPQEFVGEGEDYVKAFDIADTVELAVNNVEIGNGLSMQNGPNTSSFRTDTEIAARDTSMPRARELQRWEPGADSSIDMSLEDSGDTSWDQFATNERMYGVESTYDENIYTTAIDRSNPMYRQREEAAARIAREIEGSAPANTHVAEERQRDADRAEGLDEEARYSGVQRETPILPKRGTGAYVPPSQRPITNAPTVNGAPFDPAIISSSLAKPVPAGNSDKAVEPTAAVEDSTTTEEQTPATTDSATSPVAQTVQIQKKQAENTAEDHVRNAADAFKQFANDQKLRAKMSVEARRSNARAEKIVKLNDLKKFSENFKLKSRVPDDLVPILAKDPSKQVAIQHRAEEAAKLEEVKKTEREVQDTAATASPTPSASSQVGGPAPVDQRLSFSQQPNQRARVMANLRGMAPQQSPGKHLPQNFPANRGYPRPLPGQPLPNGMRIPTGPAIPSGEGPLSPTSATKLNVRAFEFRPAASTFTPVGSSPSPQRTTGSSMDRSNVSDLTKAVAPTASFFDKEKKPVELENRKDLAGAFDPIKCMLDADYPEEQKKIVAANGGIPKPYQTPPTWPFSKANENVSFRDSFTKPLAPSTGPSPMQTPNPNAHMPHAHQLPPHMHNTPMSGPAQRPPYMQQHSHQGMPQQAFDPRMQQFGPNGSVQSSPRFPQAQVAFNGQMPGMPMPQYGGQQMPGYGMSPSMQYRQVNMPPGGPMMMMPPPGQQHGQMAPMHQGYPPRGPGGPQYNPQMMGGVPMMQQHSTGGYMNGPGMQQGQSYSPMPPHSQPHMPAHMQNQGYAGSPRPHMMQHSGSHQGYQPGAMMQPPYGAAPSPGQQYPYHVQQRQMSSGGGMPGGGYPHMTPRQQYAMPHQPSPGMGGGMGDEGK